TIAGEKYFIGPVGQMPVASYDGKVIDSDGAEVKSVKLGMSDTSGSSQVAANTGRNAKIHQMPEEFSREVLHARRAAQDVGENDRSTSSANPSAVVLPHTDSERLAMNAGEQDYSFDIDHADPATVQAALKAMRANASGAQSQGEIANGAQVAKESPSQPHVNYAILQA